MIFYSTMISLNMKRYLPLLWGISILFFMESKSASIPETSNISSTVEPNMTTKQLSTVHVHHSETETQPATQDLTRSAAEVSVAAETTVSATVETKEPLSNISGSSTVGLAATISNSGPQVPGGSIDAPAVTTAASKEQPSHNQDWLRKFLRSKKFSETAKLTDLPQSQTTSTGMNVSAAAPSTAPVTVSEISSVTVAVSSSMSTHINELHVTTKSYSTNSSDDSTQAARNFSSPSNLSTTATTTNTSSEASEVLTPNSTASPTRISEISAVSTELSSVSQPVSVTRRLTSASHVPDAARPSSTTESPTHSISTDSANSTAKSPTHSISTDPANSTAESPTHSISTDSANSTAESPTHSISTDPANSTAKSPTHSISTDSANSTAESPTHSISTDPANSTAKSPTHSISTDSANSTTESPTPSISTDPANSTAVSTSLVGVLNPRVPKKLPIPTTKSTPATTTAAHEVSKCPPITEVKPCSSRRVVNICLITIASLALLATIFMVSTIVLCVKLSARKYKVRKPHYETEMMCISTLLPDRTNNYTRERNPIANGVLVIPNGRDYDEDGGDDVTLSSFLPDNDRYI